jgi:cytosine/adenosine deaminase-related metal-dependent hydrolase
MFETLGSSVVLAGGRVLCLDDRFRVVEGGDVVIVDGRIAAVGVGIDRPPGARVVDVSGCAVLPGFVQGHLHLGQTLFRGLAERRRLLPWLQERVWPLEAAHDRESAYWSARLGAAECLLGGTTTIQDIGIGPEIEGLVEGAVETGIRAWIGTCLMDEGATLPERMRGDTDRVLAATEQLGLRYHGFDDGRIGWLLNPRFILTCSDALHRGIVELSQRHGWPIHTHALEQQEETAAVQAVKGGRDEVAYFDDLGLLDCDLRIAHGVWLQDHHLARLLGPRSPSPSASSGSQVPGPGSRVPAPGSRNVSVVHCPSANLKLGSGVLDLPRLRAAGVPLSLGCDGGCCNNDYDALEELRLASLLQHWKNGPESFGGRETLALATRDGARALGLGDRVGRIEVGLEADLVVIDLERPELVAADCVDPHDLVAFSATRAAIRDVFVRGRQLVDRGQLVGVDTVELLHQGRQAINAVARRAGVA